MTLVCGRLPPASTRFRPRRRVLRPPPLHGHGRVHGIGTFLICAWSWLSLGIVKHRTRRWVRRQRGHGGGGHVHGIGTFLPDLCLIVASCLGLGGGERYGSTLGRIRRTCQSRSPWQAAPQLARARAREKWIGHRRARAREKWQICRTHKHL